MKQVYVTNVRNGKTGFATLNEDGTALITIDGKEKEVKASTFKRWYEVTGEVKQPEVLGAVAERVTNEGRKCEKVVIKFSFDNVNVIVTEYDGYVCDVVLESKAGEFIYRSEKMSLKDALTFLGYEGEELREARKRMMAIKKSAKNISM